MKFVFPILILFTVSIGYVHGCSLAQGPPIAIFGPDHYHYIFVGEVVGYTEEMRSPKFIGPIRGLKVKPLESFNLPIATDDYYEIFKYGVDASCQPLPTNAVYPIGTKLRIVANESILLPNRTPEKRVRLESQIFDRFSVDDPTNGFSSLETAFFDYKDRGKTLKTLVRNANGGILNSAYSDFIFLEIQKDLQRLILAKSRDEKFEILERLVYAPGIDFTRIVDPSVGKLFHVPGGSIRLPENMKPFKSYSGKFKVHATKAEKGLIRKRELLEKEGYFIK